MSAIFTKSDQRVFWIKLESSMVRAVALQTTPSGSYYNASQGVLATVGAANAALPIQIHVSRIATGLVLSWNSQIGREYRVLAETNLNQTDWVAVSDRITVTGTNISWTDTNFNSQPQHLYRIVSP